MVRLKIPEIAHQWMNEEIAELLRAIPGPHMAKKRTTVIRVASAKANQQPIREVFELEDTCSEVIWYTKWQNDPAIAAALKACEQRSLDFADEVTIAIEAHYRRERRRSVAELAAEAPRALATVMNDEAQRGSDRISAANALMGWADPDAAEKVRPASPAGNFEQTITTTGLNLAGLSDDELDRAIEAELQTGEAVGGAESPATDQAAHDDPGGQKPEDADP